MFLDNHYSPHSMRHSTACHLLEAEVDIVTIKNILGHVSVQTTQIYAEMSQDSVDRKLKEWNDTWFGNKAEIKKAKDNVPDFLKRQQYYSRSIIGSPVNINLYTNLLE